MNVLNCRRRSLFSLWLFAVVAITVTAAPAAAQFLGDRDPCWVYAVAIKESSMATREEIRERFKRVYGLAKEQGNLKLLEASGALVQAATSGQGVREALDGMAAACQAAGSSAFRDWRSQPSSPISEGDAAKHLQSVLEREGATGSNCRQKQYGSGWVTICD